MALDAAIINTIGHYDDNRNPVYSGPFLLVPDDFTFAAFVALCRFVGLLCFCCSFTSRALCLSPGREVTNAI